MTAHHILLLQVIQAFDVCIVAEINLMSVHFTRGVIKYEKLNGMKPPARAHHRERNGSVSKKEQGNISGWAEMTIGGSEEPA